MRRSSIFLLLGAVLLGLLAVLAARMVMNKGPAAAPEAEAPKTFVVVAAKPLKFGDKLTPDMLKTQPWPGALPADAFGKTPDAVGDGNRTALRDINEGEVILATAVTGGAGRLASSTLLGPEMRAVSLPVSETSGAGGFLAPGDRVDVFLTRTFNDQAFAGVVVQGARVLAVGQVSDTSTSEPTIVKSATIEVTPAEAQKIALAQAVGTLQVALRATGDESRVPLQTVNAFDTFNMRPPPEANAGAAASAPAAAAARSGGTAPAQPRPIPGGTEVRIVRGTETSVYQVPK
ncbi:Flp pilus assembly protein CpaB [Sandaracinobacter neustonicus]|uniref:Flp pilus assembly protein CpaB n=1 Tax=Sandaracinobacter neustonicus TaxID=1715348 RepID=A0A501XNG2_9SPHN|nr:Flp pilus assembly protein CpaB [Sandaracinobacter neustonicus]TPE61823.1 Flp pilus assembly protein CpaB [Sandaracinobacter neustonicus]